MTNWDDNSQHVDSVEFDYAKISRLLNEPLEDTGDQDEFAKIPSEELHKYLLPVRSLLRWVWGDGARNKEGMLNRLHIVCWHFIEELQPVSLSELARGFGQHKQALGRAEDDFKDSFPTVKTSHMRFD